MKVEWDKAKASANLREHGVSFEEAASALADWGSITVPDPEHSEGEDRFYLPVVEQAATVGRMSY